MKHFFGIITSLITAVLIIIMAEMIKDGLYPPPYDIMRADSSIFNTWMMSLPDDAFIITMLSHALAAFAAGLISSLVVNSSRMTTGMVGFSIVFIYVMIYLFSYNFPAWVVISDTVITALLGFGGVMMGSARYVN